MYLLNWSESIFSSLIHTVKYLNKEPDFLKQETDDTFHSSLFTPVGVLHTGDYNF